MSGVRPGSAGTRSPASRRSVDEIFDPWDQVDESSAIAPFIVIPGYDFDEELVQDQWGFPRISLETRASSLSSTMPANAESAAALAQRYGLRVEALHVLNEAGDFARKMSQAIAAFEKEARVVGAEHLDSVTAETLSIAVRRGTEFRMKINKILVATDFSEDAGAALDAAVEEMSLPPRILGGLAGFGCAW